MYVISRTIKIEKDFTDQLLAKFDKPSPVLNFKGFMKREILINKKNKAFNVVNISTYFDDKTAFYRWEGSPEHIALHRDKNNDHHKKPEGVIGVEVNYFDLALSQTYREKETE